jgi:hypothetical protein
LQVADWRGSGQNHEVLEVRIQRPPPLALEVQASASEILNSEAFTGLPGIVELSVALVQASALEPGVTLSNVDTKNVCYCSNNTIE